MALCVGEYDTKGLCGVVNPPHSSFFGLVSDGWGENQAIVT